MDSPIGLRQEEGLIIPLTFVNVCFSHEPVEDPACPAGAGVDRFANSVGSRGQKTTFKGLPPIHGFPPGFSSRVSAKFRRFKAKFSRFTFFKGPTP
jgi:hypothetical protein